MARRWTAPRRFLAAAVCIAALGISLFPAVLTRQLLTPAATMQFYAPIMRSIPAHINGESNLWATIKLRQRSILAPAVQTLFVIGGERRAVPLPPQTVSPQPIQAGVQRFVTFATPGEYRAYVDSVLPAAGWKLQERLGGTHAYRRGCLLLSVHRRHHLGTRIGGLTVNLRAADGAATAARCVAPAPGSST